MFEVSGRMLDKWYVAAHTQRWRWLYYRPNLENRDKAIRLPHLHRHSRAYRRCGCAYEHIATVVGVEQAIPQIAVAVVPTL